MTRDFTLEDIARVIDEKVKNAINDAVSGSEARMMKKLDEKFEESRLFTEQRFEESQRFTEQKFQEARRFAEQKFEESNNLTVQKFEESKHFANGKFEEAKDHADDRFSWLGARMDATVERLEDKIDAQAIEMRNGFRAVSKKIDSLKRDHAVRIELLEEKVT